MNCKFHVVYKKYDSRLFAVTRGWKFRKQDQSSPNKKDQGAFFGIFFMWFSYLCLFNLANNSLAVGTVISFDSVRPPCETASVKQQLIRNLIHVDRSNTFDLGIARIFSHFKYNYYHLLDKNIKKQFTAEFHFFYLYLLFDIFLSYSVFCIVL